MSEEKKKTAAPKKEKELKPEAAAAPATAEAKPKKEKAAAPAAAPTGCAAFGAGYIAVPGGDTCLKISGYARGDVAYKANQARGTAPYSVGSPGYGVQFDAQNQTEAGAVKSTILLEGGSAPGTTDAYLSSRKKSNLTAVR